MIKDPDWINASAEVTARNCESFYNDDKDGFALRAIRACLWACFKVVARRSGNDIATRMALSIFEALEAQGPLPDIMHLLPKPEIRLTRRERFARWRARRVPVILRNMIWGGLIGALAYLVQEGLKRT